jgi:hypothetical protein
MKAGYQGKDAMRANAEKAFGSSLKGATTPAKMSMSAADKIPPRPYKKGGSVKKCNMGGAMGAQALPQDPSKKQMGFKKGGKAVKKNVGGATARPFSSSSSAALKKGGKAKKCNAGGAMLGQQPPMLRDMLSPNASAQVAPRNRLVGPGPIPDMGAMKKGGKTKKMAMGGVGKIRLGQSTKSGKQVKTGRKKVV